MGGRKYYRLFHARWGMILSRSFMHSVHAYNNVLLWYVIDALSHLKRDGIHRGLVSTHKFSFGAVYYGPTQMQLKFQVLTKFLLSGWEGEVGILGNSKLEVSSPDQVFIWEGRGYSGTTQIQSLSIWLSFNGGGGVTLDTTFLKYFGGGTQGILSTKFYKPKLVPASQIVSHTLCVWRLNKEVHLKKYITKCICSVGEVHWCKTEHLLQSKNNQNVRC